MKKSLLAAIFGAAALLPLAAQAEVAFTDGRATLHAGPGREFPRIDRLRSNVRVNLYGCIDGFSWCDVSIGRERGWVDGDSLFVPYQGRRVRVMEYGSRINVPMVRFNWGYWDNYYRGRGFYRDRDHWRRQDFARRWSDADGDGVPNRFDDRPRNPYRN